MGRTKNDIVTVDQSPEPDPVDDVVGGGQRLSRLHLEGASQVGTCDHETGAMRAGGS